MPENIFILYIHSIKSFHCFNSQIGTRQKKKKKKITKKKKKKKRTCQQKKNDKMNSLLFYIMFRSIILRSIPLRYDMFNQLKQSLTK